MVFCGKPSKGCHICRERKIRCDQLPEGCSQCAKAQRGCPGYRDQLDLMFRNESQNVVRKARMRESRASKAANAALLTPPPSIRPSPYPSSAVSPAAVPPTDAGDTDAEAVWDVVRTRDYGLEALGAFEGFSTDPTFSHFTLTPSIDERATGYFVTNFVIGVHGPTRGHLDSLNGLNPNDLDSNLIASMKSVGLAGYAHVAHAPELMKNARQEYSKALRLTNVALRSPSEVKKDSTLLSVMILGIFETVTGCNQRSMAAWAEHINGAAALVKLRGVDQMKTPAGRRLFIQVTTNLLISCIQRRLPLPEHILELRKRIQSDEPGWKVQDAMIAFCEFRSQTRTGEISDPRLVLARSLELDGVFMDLFTDVPLGWEYETVYTDADPDVVYQGRYHIYYDYWIAQLWNAMRTVRIMLNDQIRDVLLAGFSAKPPQFLGPEYTAQLQVSTDVLFTLQTDILASVPQHLGYISQRHPRPPGASPVPNSHQQFLWTDFGSTRGPVLIAEDVAAAEGGHDEVFGELERPPLAGTPQVRASGGYFLLWPLYLVGAMDVTTEPVRQWVIKNLRNVGRSMGIQQALVLAELLERHEEIKVWFENQKEAAGGIGTGASQGDAEME